MPRLWQPPEAGTEPVVVSPAELPEGTHSADTQISNFWLPELRKNTFLLGQVQWLMPIIPALSEAEAV